jgi:hypothetical protein
MSAAKRLAKKSPVRDIIFSKNWVLARSKLRHKTAGP